MTFNTTVLDLTDTPVDLAAVVAFGINAGEPVGLAIQNVSDTGAIIRYAETDAAPAATAGGHRLAPRDTFVVSLGGGDAAHGWVWVTADDGSGALAVSPVPAGD